MDAITAANVKTAYELEHRNDCNQTRLEKIVDVIAEFSGTLSFIGLHLIIFTLWIGFNGLSKASFDPYPFTFLTMTVSLEAILLSGILLINQARVSAKADRRHQLDLQINLLAEQENTIMLRMLAKIAEKLNIDSTELNDYLHDTRPEEVIEIIEKVEKKQE